MRLVFASLLACFSFLIGCSTIIVPLEDNEYITYDTGVLSDSSKIRITFFALMDNEKINHADSLLEAANKKASKVLGILEGNKDIEMITVLYKVNRSIFQQPDLIRQFNVEKDKLVSYIDKKDSVREKMLEQNSFIKNIREKFFLLRNQSVICTNVGSDTTIHVNNFINPYKYSLDKDSMSNDAENIYKELKYWGCPSNYKVHINYESSYGGKLFMERYFGKVDQ